MLFNKKKKRMTPEQKQKNIDEFGTANHDEIEKIIETLDKRIYKTRCNNLNLVYKKLDKNRHFLSIYRIARRHYIIPRERRDFKYDRSTKTPTEKFLIKLDDAILKKQLVENNYDEDTAKVIAQNIRNKYSITRYDLMSNNIDDYVINSDLSVDIKSAKERYENATKIKTQTEEKTI